LTGKKREQWDCHAERVMTISPNKKTHANHECITPVMELGGREGGRVIGEVLGDGEIWYGGHNDGLDEADTRRMIKRGERKVCEREREREREGGREGGGEGSRDEKKTCKKEKNTYEKGEKGGREGGEEEGQRRTGCSASRCTECHR